MSCVLFFSDINAISIHVNYLGLVETLETVKKVSWPDIIHEHLFNELQDKVNVAKFKGRVPYLLVTIINLFAEHTPKNTIKKVQNRETILPRVGRWNVHDISDFIAKTDMTQFTIEKKCISLICVFPNMHPTKSFMEELSQIEWDLGISTRVPTKS
ncbi:hypothetical protein MKX01_040688 [Papaver californicum]|nr:hypothetical protein MKX01_040688 [Papaver californicum]